MGGGRALLVSALLVQIRAFDPVFYEPFKESFERRWVVSGKDEYKGITDGGLSVESAKNFNQLHRRKTLINTRCADLYRH
ncbi:hypothetical protein GUJ93_ZPchr0014g47214 [Zizania palustris]|uniref:Cathepsin propeptide inhibitor domain-containing protein n=1 Tax=Zizania palustris TaxID=103762 RepID=A0A8J5VRM2_ZIZPA|nr:hypothetical protein GUJ93_ZPchr0014g47214 [Zizania palustris]